MLLVPSVSRLAAASGLKVLSTSGMRAPATARSSTATTLSKMRRPLGKPAASPGGEPERVGFLRGRDGQVEPQHVGQHGPGVVLKTGDDSLRDAGQDDGLQVSARLLVGGQFREDAGIEHREQSGEFGFGDTGRELRVVVRVLGVPVVLLEHRNEQLVEQRESEPADLDERAAVDRPALVAVVHP